jgi:DNA transformation protein
MARILASRFEFANGEPLDSIGSSRCRKAARVIAGGSRQGQRRTFVKDDSFKDYVLDQLHGLASVEARRMFGGHGLYCGAKFFGIIYNGRLYFKVDAASRAQYEASDMKPFQPDMGKVMKGYYEVPAEILEDTMKLSQWAAQAVRSGAGQAAKQKRQR